VNIPAGIDHGQRLKLRGEGEAGKSGGPAGDLYVQVLVKPHEIFERQDHEILSIIPVHYSTVVLGAEIEVPTVDGMVSMKIPAGTQSGKLFRLRGKGVPILGTNQRGDHHVQISVHVPKKISQRHRELLEELKELDGGDGALDLDDKGFLDKMKEMFS
jgi:molecular chaperone DnaJ